MKSGLLRGAQTNAWKMKNNHKQTLWIFKATPSSSISEWNIKDSSFHPCVLKTFTALQDLLIESLVSNKTGLWRWQGSGENDSVSFIQQEKHMELTEIGANWVAESDMSKKSSNCSTKRNLLCVGKIVMARKAKLLNSSRLTIASDCHRGEGVLKGQFAENSLSF